MSEERMKERSRRSNRRERFDLKDWLKVIGIAVVIAFFITRFIASTTLVDGDSMRETLHDGDKLVVLRFGLSPEKLQRGDVIVFHAPDGSGRDYIKRVIAFPNEYVEIEDGLVYINGKRIEEPYINTAYTHTHGDDHWYVQEGELFVLGDNRLEGASKDSRVFGPIPAGSVIGRAAFRYYPFSKAGEI